MAAFQSPVLVNFGHPESSNCVSLEIELNQYRGFGADNPPIVPRFNGDDLWGHELKSAAVSIFDVNLTARQKADMGMHAQIGADDRFHVRGPAKSGLIDHTFHATSAYSRHVDLSTTHFTAFAAG